MVSRIRERLIVLHADRSSLIRREELIGGRRKQPRI
jgi:hypothetical protein